MKLDRLIAIYETLTPESIATLREVYADDARFRDPFNDVQGLPAIENIFRHMFEQVEMPRFAIIERVAEADVAFLVWDFRFLRAGKPHCIRGATHLRFDAAGKVREHRDYWDAAGELYSRLPLIGSLMRFLHRRLSAANAFLPTRSNYQ